MQEQLQVLQRKLMHTVNENEALNQIDGNDWAIETLPERSDSFPELDMVIRTIPGPGVELAEGEPVVAVVFDVPGRESLLRVPTLEPLRGTQDHVGALLDASHDVVALIEGLSAAGSR